MEADRPTEVKLKIFVIDDSPTGLSFVRVILEEQGYVIFTFDSPLGVTREFIRLKPDLVLLDVNMPSITGDKICRLIRAVAGGRDTPILLYSSKPAQELSDLASQCGADGFVTKSGDHSLLVHTIRERLSHLRGGSSGLYRRMPVR